MAKSGMRIPSPTESHGTESNKRIRIPKNKVRPVPEIEGSSKN